MSQQSPPADSVSQSTHALRLSDDLDSLAIHASVHLDDGWRRGDQLLLVARRRHQTAILHQLAARGCPVTYLREAGRVTTMDAAETLNTFMLAGRPRADRFRERFGEVVDRLATARLGLTIYCELVDVLAEHGEWAAAVELEHLWSDLGTSGQVALLCGYLSTHFGDERSGAPLRDICRVHESIAVAPEDALGDWLLTQHHAVR
jgi:hypothetical protein